MSEQDRTHEAFQRWRAVATPRIRRPGVAAVFQTVRRRRKRRTTLAVSCLAALLAGWTAMSVLRPPPPTDVFPTPTPTPSAPPTEEVSRPAPSPTLSATQAAVQAPKSPECTTHATVRNYPS